MRKQMRKVTAALMAAGIIVTSYVAGNTVFAAENATEVEKTSEVTEAALADMLKSVITMEYAAKAEYNAMIEKYGDVRPYSNFLRAEERHIESLLPLLEEYGVTVADEEMTVKIPDSLEESYTYYSDLEEKSITTYEDFLKQELPNDVEEVFEYLLNASEHHLRALERNEDGSCQGNEEGYRSGGSEGRGMGRGCCGNRYSNDENCNVN